MQYLTIMRGGTKWAVLWQQVLQGLCNSCHEMIASATTTPLNLLNK